MMYTTNTPKISVHEFVHEFVAFSWHCVVFYNIAQIANSLVFKGAWYCVALCGLVGFRAPLTPPLWGGLGSAMSAKPLHRGRGWGGSLIV